MRKIILYPIVILIALLTFTGCPVNPGSPAPPPVLSTKTIQFASPTPRARYLLLTNYDTSNRYIPRVTINGSERSIDTPSFSRTAGTSAAESEYFPVRRDLHLNVDINNISKSVSRSSSRAIIEDQYSSKVVDDTNNFYVFDKNNGTSLKTFTLKYKDDISGTSIKLYIWVDSSQSAPEGAITHLKAKFDGIFSDMKSLFGDHWGSHPWNNLLASGNDDIHILLTDIQDDQNSSPAGFITGYFNPADTFDKNERPYSNQCLNLVVDSYDYFDLYRLEGGGNGSWSDQSYGALSGISTIIHEFQHMIHWYKKSIVNNTNSDIFVNEMFSMTAEDLLSRKYLRYDSDTKIFSPDKSRVPFFNLFWDDNSSFHWNANGMGSLNNYAMSYVMGAYLIRNYGASYMTHYLSIEDGGRSGLMTALNATDSNTHTTETLLQEFGTAVIKSGTATQSKTFNNGSLFVISGLEINPLNLYSDSYTYKVVGSEVNRLYEFDTTKLQPTGYTDVYKAPFYSMSLTQLNDKHRTRNFLSESNIYVYLGELNSSDEVKIDLYDTTIQYSIVTPQ